MQLKQGMAAHVIPIRQCTSLLLSMPNLEDGNATVVVKEDSYQSVKDSKTLTRTDPKDQELLTKENPTQDRTSSYGRRSARSARVRGRTCNIDGTLKLRAGQHLRSNAVTNYGAGQSHTAAKSNAKVWLNEPVVSTSLLSPCFHFPGAESQISFCNGATMAYRS